MILPDDVGYDCSCFPTADDGGTELESNTGPDRSIVSHEPAERRGRAGPRPARSENEPGQCSLQKARPPSCLAGAYGFCIIVR